MLLSLSFDLEIDFCEAYEKDGIFCDSYTIHTGSRNSGSVDDTQAVDTSILDIDSSKLPNN